MIIELLLVLASITVTGLLTIYSFKIGAQIGYEAVTQPRIDPDKVAELEFEEGDPLNG